MTKIMDGHVVSSKIKKDILKESKALGEKGVIPGLAVIIAGNDPASRTYVNNKEKDCEEVSFYSEEHALDQDVSQEELLELIAELNRRPEINGILVQLPLPKHLDEKLVIERINPIKDVDAFSTVNVGRIMLNDFAFVPCTPAGIIELLEYENIDIEGKHCVVIGRSNIVGKPMAMLLLHKNATVTICHSRTKNLKDICKQADILVSAVGIAKFVKEDMVKAGAIVIDVGMNRDENGKLCGDVDFENVSKLTSYITPVPGGVGPMTRCMLLKNTIKAAKLQNNL